MSGWVPGCLFVKMFGVLELTRDKTRQSPYLSSFPLMSPGGCLVCIERCLLHGPGGGNVLCYFGGGQPEEVLCSRVVLLGGSWFLVVGWSLLSGMSVFLCEL